MAARIHPTAIVDPGAHLDNDVTVGPYAVIEGDVVIGEGTLVGPHALLSAGARIGRRCRIFGGASLGGVPQDLKFGGEKTHLFIGDDTVIREFCTLNRGTTATGKTVVGSHCLLMAYCHVAHDCVMGDHVIAANTLNLAGHVTVGDYVRFGGTCAVHQFCRIGDRAFIGAYGYVTSDVVPFALAAGTPLRVVGINKVGLERAGFDEERRLAIKRAYRTLFRRHTLLEKAIGELERQAGDNMDLQMIAAFARGGQRGLLRMSGRVEAE